jgi:hypothetical protein
MFGKSEKASAAVAVGVFVIIRQNLEWGPYRR